MTIPARPPDRNAPATDGALRALLALAWLLVIVVFWFGLFVASMRPGLFRPEAIDLFGYFLPKFGYADELLAHGRLPLWNPYEYGGVPLLGAAQPAALYPPRVLLFGLLPPVWALHAFMLLHYLLLGAGAFVMLRTFGLGVGGAAFGTLCFAFQPVMTMSHYNPIRIASFAWVPWMVATCVRTMEGARFEPALALAAVAALQALAGYPEYSVDTALVLGVLWLAAVVRKRRAGESAGALRGTMWIAAAALVAAALAAPQLVATLAMFAESLRASHAVPYLGGIGFELGTFGNGLGAWISSISTFGYSPALGVVLLAVGVVSPGRRYRWALLGVWLLGSVAYSPPLRAIPPFSLFRTFLCWATLLYVPIATFAGAGFDRLTATLAGTSRPRAHELAIALVVLVAALPFLSARSLGWLVLTCAVLAAGRLGPAWARRAIVGGLVATLGTIWTWVPPPLSPSLPHRYAAGQVPYAALVDTVARGAQFRAACGPGQGGRVVAPLETLQGVPVAARLPAVQGYPEPLAPARMSRLLEAAGLAPDRLTPLDWERLARSGSVLRLLDVGCIVSEPGHEQVLLGLGFTPGGTLGDGRMAWARVPGGIAFLAPEWRIADDEAALAALADQSFDARREVLLAEGATLPAVRGACGAGGCDPSQTTLARLDAPADGLAFRTDAPVPTYLVVAVNHAPGWRAQVDGEAVPVVRADVTLMAVALEAGPHVVRLSYRPPGFTAALWAALLALAILLAGGAWSVRARRSSQSACGGPAASSAA